MPPPYSRRSVAFRGSLLIILVISVFSAVIAQRLTVAKTLDSDTLTDPIRTFTARPTSSPCPVQRCVNCPSGQTTTSTQWPDGCWDRCVCTSTPTATITSSVYDDCPVQRCVNCPSGQTLTSTLWPLTDFPQGCWDRCVCTPTATVTRSHTSSIPCPVRRCTACPSGHTFTSTLWPTTLFPQGCWDTCVCTPAFSLGSATITAVSLTGRAFAHLEARITGAPVKRDPEASLWGQCGGSGYAGPTACPTPATCLSMNPWYS